jgi:NADH-quinone oxidoreductase subunit J
MLAPNSSALGLRFPELLSSLMPHVRSASGTFLLAQGGLVSPALIVLLCVVAGVGTVMLLPGRRERSLRTIGGVVLLAVMLIVGAILGRDAAGVHFYFWVFSVIALAGAIRVVTHPRPVYSALYFVLTVFATAGLFILLWAEFMAAALVLIYAGAILITYVFVIMLASQAISPADAVPVGNGDGAGSTTSPARGLATVTEYDAVSREPVVAAAVGFALMGVLLFVIFDKADPLPGPTLTPRTEALRNVDEPIAGSTQQLGMYLFQNQVVNLELAGLILTISMVGAIVIARRRIVGAAAEGVAPIAHEVMTTPATPVDDDPHSIPVYGTDNPRQKAYPET